MDTYRNKSKAFSLHLTKKPFFHTIEHLLQSLRNGANGPLVGTLFFFLKPYCTQLLISHCDVCSLLILKLREILVAVRGFLSAHFFGCNSVPYTPLINVKVEVCVRP